MPRERRRVKRASVDAHANVAYPGTHAILAKLGDISDGGASLVTHQRFPWATKVYFEFMLPGQEKPIRVSGEVAWQDATGRTGFRFIDVPQASRRLIQSWLQLQGSDSKPQATEMTIKAEIKVPPSEPSNAGNRRGERRFPCRLGAEVYRLGTSVPNRCILTDLSEGGCYVETPSPFAGQSGVEIVVRTSQMKLKIRGQVLATHPGYGMGVRFMFKDASEREEILRLLAVLAVGPSIDEVSR